MLYAGRGYLEQAPWLGAFPGMAIFLPCWASTSSATGFATRWIRASRPERLTTHDARRSTARVPEHGGEDAWRSSVGTCTCAASRHNGQAPRTYVRSEQAAQGHQHRVRVVFEPGPPRPPLRDGGLDPLGRHPRRVGPAQRDGRLDALLHRVAAESSRQLLAAHGTARAGRCTLADPGRSTGRAGDTSVRVRTRSGRVAATTSETVPPRELPTRCTGPAIRASMSATTVRAWVRTE